MPGFAYINGLFSCFNQRVIDATKPKTITFDAEIPIGDDQNGQLQCVRGLVHYFVPQNEAKPDDDRKYLVSSKVISVHSQTQTDENSGDYDLEIEALTVSYCPHDLLLMTDICLQFFLMPDIDEPPRALITIAGQVFTLYFFQLFPTTKSWCTEYRKINEHQFYFDITQYFLRQMSMTAFFHCHFPEGNL